MRQMPIMDKLLTRSVGKEREMNKFVDRELLDTCLNTKVEYMGGMMLMRDVGIDGLTEIIEDIDYYRLAVRAAASIVREQYIQNEVRDE